MSLGIGINDDPELRRRLEMMRMAQARAQGANPSTQEVPEISGPSSHGGWPGAIVYGAAQAIGKGADMVGKAWRGELSPQEAAEGSFDVATAGVGGPSGALMAGGSKTLPLIKEALPGLQKTYEPIKAYHGSPHDFEKFDVSKIGTGEGAQAYGHGLYFAENERVAKSYRDNLSAASDPRDYVSEIINYLRGSVDGEISKDTIALALRKYPETKAIADSDDLMSSVHRAANGYDIKSDTYSPDAMRALQSLDKSLPPPSKGHMYEVELQADPEHFLDWDKPLSEQSGHVRKSLGLDDVTFAPSTDEAADAIRGAREAGIPLREYGPYRELQERLKQSKQFGFDRLGIDPPNTSDSLGDITGHTLYSGLSKNTNEGMPNAARALQEKGIPGIRYLDQQSRNAGEGSRNYVVFSDELIKLARKYGIPLGMLGGLGAMGGVPEDKRPRA